MYTGWCVGQTGVVHYDVILCDDVICTQRDRRCCTYDVILCDYVICTQRDRETETERVRCHVVYQPILTDWYTVT